MKKFFIHLLAIAVIAVAAAACQKSPAPSSELVKMTFSASCAQTKTALDASHKVLWEGNETITVFADGTGYPFTTTETGETAKFQGTIAEASSYLALYPADDAATASGSVIRATLPSAQKAVKDGFDPAAALTVAQSDGSNLAFKNVSGLVQCSISSSNIKSIIFEGKSGENVAGQIDITVAAEPSCSVVNGASSVTLKNEGNALEAGTYYIPILPQTFSNGFRFILTDTEGKVFVKETDSPVTIARSSGINFKTLDEGATFGTPSYSIDINAIPFSDTYVYDATDADGNKIAVVVKEYLGAGPNQQAITVYPVTTGKALERSAGLVARVLKSAAEGVYTAYNDVSASDPVHCGIFNSTAGVLAYSTPGESAAAETVYVSVADDHHSTLSTSAPEGVTISATVSPRFLVLSDRGDTHPYGIVKIGTQMWIAEDLQTTKLRDGTSLTLQNDGTAGTANTKHYWVNNGTYFYSAYCIGAIAKDTSADKNISDVLSPTSWKVPTKGDLNNLINFVPISAMLAVNSTKTPDGTNITLFGNTWVGRVTSGTWAPTNCPLYWSSTIMKNSVKVYLMKIETNTTNAPTISNNPSTNGFTIRIMRGLY